MIGDEHDDDFMSVEFAVAPLTSAAVAPPIVVVAVPTAPSSSNEPFKFDTVVLLVVDELLNEKKRLRKKRRSFSFIYDDDHTDHIFMMFDFSIYNKHSSFFSLFCFNFKRF